MSTQYPIKFNRGKLVKYNKPYKYKPTGQYFEKRIDRYDEISTSSILEWIDENGGTYENSYLKVREEWGDYAIGEITFFIPATQTEIDKAEKAYAKQLKDWEEWKVLSKVAKESDEFKEKEKRAKSLKTQENNLLKKLERIRKQQEKI